jgi:hypothetical protein
MSRYTITEDDGDVIVDTDRAQDSWADGTRWNGQNHVSLATGSEFITETLYLSAKGRWYIEVKSRWQGSTDNARFIEPREAALWLLRSDHELPEQLAHFEGQVTE